MSNKIKPLAQGRAFELIRQALTDHRPIIPLFGSGISVDAGVPKSSLLADYIVALDAIAEKEGWNLYENLTKWNWLHRHDVCVHWHTGQVTQGYLSLTQLFNERRSGLYLKSCINEIQRVSPIGARLVKDFLKPDTASLSARTDYRSLLNTVTRNDLNLIDAFFDHFIRGRQPSTTHQFIAFMIRTLRIKLILTTNFDPLIETALRNEGFQPTVYEVPRDGSLPSPILVRSQPISIVKLHGGTHSLMAGHDLDEPLPVASLHQIRQYFEFARGERYAKGPLLLVLGYSGSDRRVMDIVQDHASRWERGEDANVLWVSTRGELPSDLADLTASKLEAAKSQGDLQQPAVVCAYRSAHLFLQELYKVLESQYAVSRSGYRTIVSAPRSTVTRFTRDLPTVPADQVAGGYLVIWEDHAGSGTSSVLQATSRANDLDQTHEIIWIDACDLSTRAALFSAIEDEFVRLDRGNLRLTRPLYLGDVDYLQTEEFSKLDETGLTVSQFVGGPQDDEDKAAVAWITNAMRRSNYVLCIDSLGEFASRHPSMPSYSPTDSEVFWHRIRALRLLGQLCNYSREFGRSLLMAAMTPMYPPSTPLYPPSAPRERIGISEQLSIATCHQSNAHAVSMRDLTTSIESENHDGPHQRAKKAVSEFEQLLTNSDEYKEVAKALILAMGALFRRPRSRVALLVSMLRYSEIASELARVGRFPNNAEECISRICQRLKDGLEQGRRRESSQDSELFDNCLKELCAQDLLGSKQGRVFAHLEGGFYWMHLESRDAIFERARKNVKLGEDDFPLLSTEILARMYDRLASFAIDDVYERSRDLSAFLEYIHYRFLSVRYFYELSDRSESAERAWQERLAWLVGAIDGECSNLLARGQPTMFIGQLRQVLAFIIRLDQDVNSERLKPIKKSIHKLLALHGYFFMACGKPRHAIVYYLWHAIALTTKQEDANGESVFAGARTQLPQLTYHGYSSHLEFLCKVNVLVARYSEALLSVRAVPEELTGVHTASELARLVVEPIVFSAKTLSRPLFRDQLGAHFSEYLARRAEARKICRGILRRCRRKYQDYSDSCDYTERMKVHEPLALVVVRQAHWRSNELLSDIRFAWLSDGKALTLESGATRGLNVIARRCLQAVDLLRTGASTSIGRNIESYLHTIRGAILYFTGQEHDASVSLNRALAVLDVPAGPRDRATAALAYLVKAEGLLYSVRRAILSENTKEFDLGRGRDILERARGLLPQAREQLDQSCADNKWRIMYYYLTASHYFLDFLCSPESDPTKTRDLLRSALREVVHGLSICGVYSDRRLIMRALMIRIEQEAMIVFGSHWEKERSRCGIASHPGPSRTGCKLSVPPLSELIQMARDQSRTRQSIDQVETLDAVALGGRDPLIKAESAGGDEPTPEVPRPKKKVE